MSLRCVYIIYIVYTLCTVKRGVVSLRHRKFSVAPRGSIYPSEVRVADFVRLLLFRYEIGVELLECCRK